MRVKRGNVLRKRHKKILKLAKGFIGARSRIFKVANIAVMKKLKYQYRDRRVLKRNMRSLWIIRINAAVREMGLSYSRFMNMLIDMSNFSALPSTERHISFMSLWSVLLLPFKNVVSPCTLCLPLKSSILPSGKI